MSKKKFILLSILKTWLFSTVVSVILVIVFIRLTREPVKEYSTSCDMSGLAYGFVVMGMVFLAVVSFSSLFSLLKPFQSKIKTALCWFLLPVSLIISYFFIITGGQAISRDDVLFLLISNVPWLAFWTCYYFKFNRLYLK